MTADRQDGMQAEREERIESFARAAEQAREVLRERGLSPEQIEAQLNRVKRDDLYDL